MLTYVQSVFSMRSAEGVKKCRRETLVELLVMVQQCGRGQVKALFEAVFLAAIRSVGQKGVRPEQCIA